MTTAQQQFLELLRAGLWDIKADPELFPIGKTDWAGIMRIAKEQTVALIVADGIETLPQELYPPREMMLKLMMLKVKTSQMHQLLNNTLNQIVNALNAKNIPSVLLKGQGVAQNYRKPVSRSCGDIDLYTGVKGYKDACDIIEGLSTKAMKAGIESDHHMHLSLNGVEIEVHRHADMLPGKKQNQSLQKWTQDSIDANFGTALLPKWDNGGTAISSASPTFDAFFILHHAVRHMTTEGVGFRQICDWTMYLHRHHAEIDTQELRKRLKEFNMELIWKEFSILAVNILGLPAEDLPIKPTDQFSCKTEKILKQVFISGNFGRSDANGRDHSKVPYLKRKWRSFRFQSSRLLKLFDLFPRYITSYMWHWITSAMCRFITGSDR